MCPQKLLGKPKREKGQLGQWVEQEPTGDMVAAGRKEASFLVY